MHFSEDDDVDVDDDEEDEDDLLSVSSVGIVKL